MDNVRIPVFTEADLHRKVVLVRMDHNVVKKGKIKDSMRIDATVPTLLHIYKKGGLPILMSHVGRPLDKKTGQINITSDDDVRPIVDYLEAKLSLKGFIPSLPMEGTAGISDLTPLEGAVGKLRAGECDFIYLPNTRWFKGEEAKDSSADDFAGALAKYADVYVNDAFGSWQAHATTVGITKYLPTYAGLLMMKEIGNLRKVFEPSRPLVSVVAGSKFDTKIGPLSSLIRISDHLVLGGVIYNAYLAAKYGISIAGLTEEDVSLARRFIQESADVIDRIVELPVVIEADSMESRTHGSYRERRIADLPPETKLNYVLDAAPESFANPSIQKVFANASTIFVNAVMGYTAMFGEGTSAMYRLIDGNTSAAKLFGGGDTIQDFKELLPGVFAKAQNDPSYYFFTGGGAILDAIVQNSPYGMKPVQALIIQ